MSATDIYRIAFIEGATKAYALQTERIEQLEQLCNDLFNFVCAETIGIYITREQFVELSERMDDLGLLEESYD